MDLKTVEESCKLIRSVGHISRSERGRIPGVRQSRGIWIISCDPLSPVASEITTGSFGLLIHGRRIRNPIKAMIMSGTSNLPLVTIPVIFILQEWSDHIFHESLSSDGHVVSDEMWLVLHPIPDELTPYVVVSLRHLRKAGKVPVKVMPLHISSTKGYEDRRHVLREEVGLSMEVTTLIPPKGTCSGQI
jgi:hypothetical protein